MPCYKTGCHRQSGLSTKDCQAKQLSSDVLTIGLGPPAEGNLLKRLANNAYLGRKDFAMSTEKIRVGILGCGNIAKPYADDLMTYPQIDLVGVADLEQQRAQDLAAKHNITAYSEPATLINDPQIDL